MKFLHFKDQFDETSYIDPREVRGIVNTTIFASGGEIPGSAIHFSNYMILVRGSASETAKRIEDAREGK